jgi:hypothetical protein
VEVRIVERHLELAEIGEIHLGAVLARQIGRKLDELPVPGRATERRGESEQPRHGQLEVMV